MAKAKQKRVMKPSEKAKWVKALLSGKFKQGTGSLRDRDEYTGHVTYCCLGVACKAISGTEPRECASYLSPRRFGLSSELQTALAIANDTGADRAMAFKHAGYNTYPGRPGRKASFKTIANWIQKNL